MSRTQREYFYRATFTGDYMTLMICVEAPDDERAEQYAKQTLLDYHGIDTDDIGVWDITIEQEGELL